MLLLPWGSLHVHSRYSAKDALDSCADMVAVAAANGYGMLGLTDHGTIAGIFDHYRLCRSAGIMPVPGIEAYISYDRNVPRPVTWHMGIVANTSRGWENLVHLANEMHLHFRYKPTLDLQQMLRIGANGGLDGLWAMTGCFFGILPTALRCSDDPAVSIGAAANVLRLLTRMFDGRVMVELQHHGISTPEHDDEGLVQVLCTLADRASLPTIITSDSHYAYKDARPSHEMLKRMSSWSDDPDSAVFPGNGYWLPHERFMRRRFEPAVWDRAMAGLHGFMEGYGLRVPELDTFSVKMPQLASVEGSADDALEQRIGDALPSTNFRIATRVNDEMQVIKQSEFSPYILLAAEVTDFCRSRGIKFITRGSASGSYVCFINGVTQIDPLKWKLRFDRFLSSDRSKPPDIDLDVQHDRRQEVLDYLSSNYSVSHIGTWRELSESDELDEEGNSKGSLWVKYYSMLAKKGEEPDDADKALITRLATHRPFDGIGVHAAGLLIAQDESVLGRLPQQWIASSKKMVTALDKDQIEELGYVKLDVLGLKTLSAVAEMERTTGQDYEDIPLNDPAVYRMIASGNTSGVFQLSGHAQRKGLVALRPNKFNDIIVALALFRPAVMQSGAMNQFLALRANRTQRVIHHEVIERHVGITHGFVLYQEQVVGILRDLGMGVEMLNSVLKAVKASNASIGNAHVRLADAKQKTADLAIDNGFSDEDITWLDNAMQAYAAYGFNLAHATSYAHLAYRTAWYRHHYPTQYWAAMLSVYAGSDKESRFRSEAVSCGVRMLPAHVNTSQAGYTVEHKPFGVRKGLQSINGIGEKVAKAVVAHAPYSSIEDFALRATGNGVSGRQAFMSGHGPEASGGALAALYEAGAFNGLPERVSPMLDLEAQA